MVRLFSILLSVLLLSGCTTYRINVSFQEPAFNLEVLKKSSSVIVATPAYITLTDFQKTFEKAYMTNENFMEKLVNNLTANLRSAGYDFVADNSPNVYTRIMEDSVKFISSNNAQFVICIRSVKIDQVLINYGIMESSPGMNREQQCKVGIEVSIVNLETKKVLMTFEVSDTAKVSLFDYQNTLKKAVEKATETVTKKLLQKKLHQFYLDG